MSKLKPLRLKCRECKTDKPKEELKLYREPSFGHHYYVCKTCRILTIRGKRLA